MLTETYSGFMRLLFIGSYLLLGSACSFFVVKYDLDFLFLSISLVFGYIHASSVNCVLISKFVSVKAGNIALFFCVCSLSSL